jgi:hypothetical protein
MCIGWLGMNTQTKICTSNIWLIKLLWYSNAFVNDSNLCRWIPVAFPHNIKSGKSDVINDDKFQIQFSLSD